jgi:hypothetical protein
MQARITKLLTDGQLPHERESEPPLVAPDATRRTGTNVRDTWLLLPTALPPTLLIQYPSAARPMPICSAYLARVSPDASAPATTSRQNLRFDVPASCRKGCRHSLT